MEDTTHDLVDRWLNATVCKAEADSMANRASTDLSNAVNALGKRLDPGDMKISESIRLWARLNEKQERLVVVTKIGTGSYNIVFRGEGRE